MTSISADEKRLDQTVLFYMSHFLCVDMQFILNPNPNNCCYFYIVKNIDACYNGNYI